MIIEQISLANTMPDLVARVQQVIDELNKNVLKLGDMPDTGNAAFALEANNAAFFGGYPPSHYEMGTANNANFLNGKTEDQLNANSALTANNSTYAFGKSEVTLLQSIVASEVPSGNANGINTVFTTINTFRTGSTMVYLNGLRLRCGASYDYTESSSNSITFISAPFTGDSILVDYVKG